MFPAFILVFLLAIFAGMTNTSADRVDHQRSRGAVEAMDMAVWHQAAVRHVRTAAPTHNGAIAKAAVLAQIPPVAVGSYTFAGSDRFRSLADGTGWVATYYVGLPQDGGWVQAALTRQLDSAMNAGRFNKATGRIESTNRSLSPTDYVVVPAALRGPIPDGAPIIGGQY